MWVAMRDLALFCYLVSAMCMGGKKVQNIAHLKNSRWYVRRHTEMEHISFQILKVLIFYSVTSQILVTYRFMWPEKFCIGYICHVTARLVAAYSRNSATSLPQDNDKMELCLKEICWNHQTTVAKVTINFTQQQAMKAQKGSRVTALLFL